MNRPSPRRPAILGPLLYGSIFIVALPCLLVAWARATEVLVTFPVPDSRLSGGILALFGAALMAAGMAAIVIYGGGLPMNAYPPPRLVTRGIFRILAHPIYAGFSILCLGLSIVAGSASGLWLVSPVVALGAVALVQGYEKQDLLERFGGALPKPLLHLPEDEATAPGPADRWSVLALAVVPWLLAQQAIRLLGASPATAEVFPPLAASFPTFNLVQLSQVGGYLFVLLAPFIAAARGDLRRLLLSGLAATGMAVLGFMAFPFALFHHPAWPQALPPAMLALYVAGMLLAARAWASRKPWGKMAWCVAPVLIGLRFSTANAGVLLAVLSGLGIAGIAAHVGRIWEAIRRWTEDVANMWKEWRLGPLRIINHGIFGGLGAFIGLSIAGLLVGPARSYALPIMGAAILCTSALWAQVIEGSPSLLRPYGWYGGVLGGILGILGLGFLGEDPWIFAAAFCVAAPWAQSLGRLRCLVQGCCHGRESAREIGIRYFHPRSRVVRLSRLGGVPVHPTPLYSILWNLVVAVVVARIWLLQAPASVVLGVYLILSGLGRFVEESYRGEPQTPVYAGLRFYQWAAVASLLLGVFATMIAGTPAAPAPEFNWGGIAAAAGFGVVAGLLMGVDFPDSNRRFARLA